MDSVGAFAVPGVACDLGRKLNDCSLPGSMTNGRSHEYLIKAESQDETNTFHVHGVSGARRVRPR
jgi:hypothetical protein